MSKNHDQGRRSRTSSKPPSRGSSAPRGASKRFAGNSGDEGTRPKGRSGSSFKGKRDERDHKGPARERPYRERTDQGEPRHTRQAGDGPWRQDRQRDDARIESKGFDGPKRPQRERNGRDRDDTRREGPRREGPRREGPHREGPRRDHSERNHSFGAQRGGEDVRPRSPRSGPRRDERAPQRFSSPRPRREEGAPRTPPRTSTMEGDRIAKVMARVGLCSRRDAEAWIEEGRVSVNGEVLTSPALNVLPADRIMVDGRPLAQRERTRLFLFNKPRGLVTTDHDPEGRPTVFSALPEWMPRVVTIGRLDINTEGLLLLTNDGGLARVLELPSTGWLRRYRVRANGTIDQAVLDKLLDGVTIDGVDYAGIEAKLDRVQGANVWLTMGLREGKNREIKRVLEHLGLAVNRLIRLSFGPFQLGELGEGDVEEIKTRILRDQLGDTLAQEAGCDFDGPIVSSPEALAFQAKTSRGPAPRRSDYERRDHQDHNGGSRRNAKNFSRQERNAPDVEELPPRKDRPPPRTRKHVSALRAARTEAERQRRPIERSETTDRKGRSVAVERVSSKRKAKRGAHDLINKKPRSTDRSEGRSQGRSEDRSAGRFKGHSEGRGQRDNRGKESRSFEGAGKRSSRPPSKGRPSSSYKGNRPRGRD